MKKHLATKCAEVGRPFRVWAGRPALPRSCPGKWIPRAILLRCKFATLVKKRRKTRRCKPYFLLSAEQAELNASYFRYQYRHFYSSCLVNNREEGQKRMTSMIARSIDIFTCEICRPYFLFKLAAVADLGKSYREALHAR